MDGALLALSSALRGVLIKVMGRSFADAVSATPCLSTTLIPMSRESRVRHDGKIPSCQIAMCYDFSTVDLHLQLHTEDVLF